MSWWIATDHEEIEKQIAHASALGMTTEEKSPAFAPSF
jgi:hypothetical protein